MLRLIRKMVGSLNRKISHFLGMRSIKKWSQFSSVLEFENHTRKRFFLFSREYSVLPFGLAHTDYSRPEFGIEMWWDQFGKIVTPVAGEVAGQEKFLDLGPNMSFLPDVMARKGFSATCIDYAPGAVAAQAIRGHEAIYGDFLSASIDAIVGDRKFDLIVSKGVLSLDDVGGNLSPFLRSVKSSLAKEGGLVLITPMYSDHPNLGYEFVMDKYLQSNSRREFHAEGFKEVVVEGLNAPRYQVPVTLMFGNSQRLSGFSAFPES